jgi:hypothetical protein
MSLPYRRSYVVHLIALPYRRSYVNYHLIALPHRRSYRMSSVMPRTHS